MFDGSTLPLQKNLDTAVSLMGLCAENELVLEIRQALWGEEDGVNDENAPSQGSTPP